MAERTRWQYCQIEVGENSLGVLKQFSPDRPPVETNLHQNWPAMVAKLGEQGWELISAFPTDPRRGHGALTYVFKRVLSVSGGSTAISAGSPPPPPPSPPPADEPGGPASGFEPLRGT